MYAEEKCRKFKKGRENMKQAKQSKLLSILLTVIMVIAMFPMTVFAENDKVAKVSENEPQNLYVGNTAIIDNGNLTGNEIQGVSYSNGTLYLTGTTVSDAYSFIYNSKDTSSAIYSDASLTISLKNENMINASAGNAIFVLGEAHIIGQGSLESTNTSVGICADSIILDYDGAMDFSCQWEGLKAVDGDILICNGSLDITSLREWASSIGTLAGDLYVQGGNLKIEEKSLNAYACYIRGNAYFSGGVIETVGENSEIYVYGDCTISAGDIKAEQIRTQNGGALTISGGTLDIYGRGLWSSGNILILADSMCFSGKRIYSDKKIHIDTSEVVLGEEVEKLQMEGSAFVINSLGSFPYQFKVFKEAYYDMSRKVAYINNSNTYEADISFYEGISGNKTYVKGCVAYTNGGTISSVTAIEDYKLATPIKPDYIFDGWYENEDFSGDDIIVVEPGKTYYAKWIKPEPVEIQYSETKPIVVPGMTDMTGWSSSDESVVTVDESGNATAVNVGTAKISAEGVYKGRKQNFTITVNVSPMLITYGSTGDDAIGWDHTYNRPAVVYSQPVGESEEQLSDHIWFYPAKESVDASSGEKIYIPDTEAAHIELEQGRDFTFSYTQNDNHAESVSVLPFLETLDSEGNSEAIDVIVDMQNENYQFVTIGTLWKPWNQILLRVTVMAEGMERISMMNGDELLQNSLEKRILEYTGEGVAPAYDLTGISAEDIEEFTVHFHSVIEGISYDTHLYNKQPAELSADAVQAIAPKELGVYSMVVNGQNDEAKKYAYVSRRFEITKGNPTGEPEFDAVDSNVELSAIELSGSMKNAAGKPVEGVFEWIDDSQTVEQGVGYAWRFTPDDTEHYNAAEGESVVYPEEKPGSDKEDLAALIEYAQDAKNAENYKYVVPKVKELFEKALEDAIGVNAKEDATQKEIDAAYDALLAKVHLLDFTGNTESLTVLVGTASGKVEAMYTKESWAPFAEALEAAREVLADENALQEEIDIARDVLQAAMDALVENPIDTSKLEKLVADASVYEENLENYIPSTAESFMAALDGAREVLAGSEITQDAVDSAYATLLNAIFGLREIPNKDRLEELLGKVEAMDLSSYSEETANAVKAAVAMAAAVMEDENANQKQVDLAVTALEEAVASLEAKEEVGTGDINTDNTESGDIGDGSKKDDSSVTDQKVASNDEGSKDTANKTTTAKTNAKTAAQTGDAAKAAVPAVAAAAALLAVWFVWKKK